jgi:hypothetical protein
MKSNVRDTLPSMASQSQPYRYTLVHFKRINMTWGKTLLKMRSIQMFSTTLPERFLIPRRFSKNLKYQISCKSVQWGWRFSMRKVAETNMIKLTVAFRSSEESFYVVNSVACVKYGRAMGLKQRHLRFVFST